jgi:proteasome lid subunit RPN8/RPN11
MIRIEREPWDAMLAHAVRAYPNECCGAMLGALAAGGAKRVTRAIPLENAFAGPQATRYEIRPEDLLEAEKAARAQGLSLIGIYHSHPDCDAYFSETDLKNSCPWYVFLVLSIRGGRFDHASCWRPDPELTHADSVPLIPPEGEPEVCRKS